MCYMLYEFVADYLNVYANSVVFSPSGDLSEENSRGSVQSFNLRL